MLLPAYLWLMLPQQNIGAVLRAGEMLPAAAVLIGAPLLLAAASERWMEARPERAIWRERLAWCAVPLLALVVFLIAAAQVGTVRNAGELLVTVTPVFVGSLLLAALLAALLARTFALPVNSGRALAYSLGTRNSFVVLPFALALPPGWETTAVVIAYQSIVELFRIVLYLWWLPRRLFRDWP